MNLLASGKTDIGLRRKVNEDSYSIDHDFSLFMIADGIGGQPAGDVASRMAIAVAREHIKRTLDSQEPFLGGIDNAFSPACNRLKSAFLLANMVIQYSGVEHPEQKNMGTTLSAVWRAEPGSNRISLAHVGDCRIYLIRRGEIRQLTHDHTVLGELLREGLAPEDTYSGKGFINFLTRHLGQSGPLEVDLADLELQEGDLLLMSSDGLSRMLTEEEIISIIRRGYELPKTCSLLIEAALNNGGKDNITVLLVSSPG